MNWKSKNKSFHWLCEAILHEVCSTSTQCIWRCAPQLDGIMTWKHQIMRFCESEIEICVHWRISSLNVWTPFVSARLVLCAAVVFLFAFCLDSLHHLCLFCISAALINRAILFFVFFLLYTFVCIVLHRTVFSSTFFSPMESFSSEIFQREIYV